MLHEDTHQTGLFKAGVDIKIWTHAFMHILRIIFHAIPRQGQDTLHLFLSTGKKDNFKHMWVFGCQVWVCPTGFGKKGFKYDVQSGYFPGNVPHTDQLILYFSYESEWGQIASYFNIVEEFNALLKGNNNQFRFKLHHDDLYGHVYINTFADTSTVDQAFHNSTWNNLRGSFINHFDVNYILCAKDATENLEHLSQAHLQKVQGVSGKNTTNKVDVGTQVGIKGKKKKLLKLMLGPRSSKYLMILSIKEVLLVMIIKKQLYHIIYENGDEENFYHNEGKEFHADTVKQHPKNKR